MQRKDIRVNGSESKPESFDLVHARLRLAKALLEESDQLEGSEGYARDTDKHWLHARHEREALVTYLLLTCFDMLGREEEHLPFGNWVNSNKKCHVLQKNAVLDNLPQTDDPLNVTKLLLAQHSEIFGVKNSFYSGMNKLTATGKERFFNSINLGYLPGHCNEPNVGYPLELIEDPAKEINLKKAYIFRKRNNFTHNLEQFHMSSTPMHPTDLEKPTGSWMAKLEDGKITYWGVHEDREKHGSGHYVYSLNQWPFVLFQVLYEAIKIPFDVTDIDLKFYLLVINSSNNTSMRIPYLSHSEFKKNLEIAAHL